MDNKKDKLLEAVEHLKKGGVIIYPTETAYGLGCDATNQLAVDLVFKIKQRSKDLPLPLIAGSLEMVEKWAVLNNKAKQLAKDYWPGALTLILPWRKNLAQGCFAKDNTVAMRVSKNDTARQLSLLLNNHIVSTSANLSGQEEIYSAEKIKIYFKKEIEKYNIYVVDGGELPFNKPSTIAQIDSLGEVKILRQGEIKIVDK